MLLRLQTYEVTVKYRPGKQMQVTDALSRLTSEETASVPDRNMQIHDICRQFSSVSLQEVTENSSRQSLRPRTCWSSRVYNANYLLSLL